MRKYLFLVLFVSGLAINSFSQLQIGAGPAIFMDNNQNFKIDYTLMLGYKINHFDIGFEFIKNDYKSEGKGKDYYQFYQYQVFGRYYPLRKNGLFLKGGANISDEFYHLSINSGDEKIVVEENGTLLGLEGGVGFQDRLIKKMDLFINVSLTYNYLFLLRDEYYFNYHKETVPFYALKMSLIYQFDLKKKN
jgi:hypothetical protein